MTSIELLAAVVLGTLAVFMAYGSPVYAQQSTPTVTNTGSATDSVVGTDYTIPVQLVRRGGSGHAFRAGRVGRFHHFRRGALFVGGYYSYGGSDYVGCGEGCYQEGNKTCIWNGYNYRCYVTSEELY